MAQERIENGAVTTLNGTINDSVTTVVASDASLLSLTPQFRIIIDSEIMLVTAVSGNSLTVARGAEGSTAAAHTDGAVLAQIITRDGIRRHQRDWNNALFDDTDGYPQQILDDTGATIARASFTWNNQGSAVDADNNSGSFLFTVDSTGADSVRLFERTLTAPWKVTAAFIPTWLGTGTKPAIGLAVRDSTDGDFKALALEVDSIRHDRWTNNTTFGSNVSDNPNFYVGKPIWLQIEDDNVDHFLRVSNDGVNFLELVQETRTTHTAAPDRVGVYINNPNTTFDLLATMTAWIEE